MENVTSFPPNYYNFKITGLSGKGRRNRNRLFASIYNKAIIQKHWLKLTG